jgi:hypothetical protein
MQLKKKSIKKDLKKTNTNKKIKTIIDIKINLN